MAKTEEMFDEITMQLTAHPAVVRSQMFGMPCLKVKGKAFLGVLKEDMVFKLTGQEHARALALEGAVLSDPSGRGRPMKEWVQIPPSHSSTWKGFAEAAYLYVASLAK